MLITFVWTSVMFVVGITLSVTGLVLLERRPPHSAPRVLGQVVALHPGTGTRHPVVAWHTADGGAVQKVLRVPAAAQASFVPGLAVWLRYDPRKPLRMAVEGVNNAPRRVAAVLLTLAGVGSLGLSLLPWAAFFLTA